MVTRRPAYILRKAVLGGGGPKQLPSPSPPYHVLPKRNMAFPRLSNLTTNKFADETKKWEKITYVGIATCTVLAIYKLAKGHHPEFEEPQKPYPYLRIRNKDFPWGPDSLFETIKKKHSHDK